MPERARSRHMLQSLKPLPTTDHRPLIGIIADGASVYGRDIMLGATQYINAHCQWDIHGVVCRVLDKTIDWPICEGAITAGLAPAVFSVVCARSRHVVSCSSVNKSSNACMVCLDYAATGKMAAEHLIECGLQNFSYYGELGKLPSTQRAEGFAAAVCRRGLSYIPCPLTFSGLDNSVHAKPWIELTDWLKNLPKPIGIMAYDDAAGYYLSAACRHSGINVPEQIAIIGVNNDKLFCEIACTPLSSVETQFTRFGFAAAHMLDRLLQGEQLSEQETDVRITPIGVVKRRSTDLLAVNDPQLAEALRFIRQHACEPCSVEQVTQHVAMGRSVLERRLMQKVGRTPGEEIMRIRIDTAKRLLQQTELRLHDIATQCGFSCDSSFARAFHNAVGDTPLAYRRTAKTTNSVESV